MGVSVLGALRTEGSVGLSSAPALGPAWAPAASFPERPPSPRGDSSGGHRDHDTGEKAHEDRSKEREWKGGNKKKVGGQVKEEGKERREGKRRCQEGGTADGPQPKTHPAAPVGEGTGHSARPCPEAHSPGCLLSVYTRRSTRGQVPKAVSQLPGHQLCLGGASKGRGPGPHTPQPGARQRARARVLGVCCRGWRADQSRSCPRMGRRPRPLCLPGPGARVQLR